MNRRTIRALITGAAVLGFGLLRTGFPGQVQATPAPVKAKLPVLCSDFKVTLNLQKSNSGAVVMTAKVCNEGPGGYSNAAGPLDGYFMVYTWHPPKTPAQEANIKFYAHTDLGTAMKPSECKSFRYQYQVENFSRWGTFPASASERQGMKEFVALVEKKGTTGFTSCEDTDMSNSVTSVDVPYMEKIK